MMKRVDAVVIGAGQAGLAMSHCLAERGIEHVVLERGRVAESWISERWDSLRLLTPNWQSRLPGWSYDGSDPDGFMTAPEVQRYLADYAGSFAAPVWTGTEVLAVERVRGLYRVTTSRETWLAEAVVVACGQCQAPSIPHMADRLPPAIRQVASMAYRNPGMLPSGGVLVVGASASGVQLADEIRRSGRDVTLSVGSHTRLPRAYRGRDIMWWMDRIGVLHERSEDVRNLEAARRAPSLQLTGRAEGSSLDLRSLRDAGVRLTGRLTGFDNGIARFADDLGDTTAAADARLNRLIRRIDDFIASRPHLAAREQRPLEPFVPEPGPARLDLEALGIQTVLWATGYRRHYPWLKVPVLDPCGEIRHRGGVAAVPGLYVLGLRFLRRRNSNFIDGVGDDARALSAHIAARLAVSAGSIAA